MDEIHERLQWMRRQRGFETAADAARAYGWNEVTYRAHEAGPVDGRGIKRSVAEKYAAAFRYSLSWFLTGEGSSDSETAEIVNIWDRIPDRNRDAAKRMLEGLADDDEKDSA